MRECLLTPVHCTIHKIFKPFLPCSLIETEKWAVTVLKIQTFLQLFKILILYKIFPPLCPLWQPAACCLSYKWTLIKSTAIFSGQHQPTAPVQKLPASILILTIMICHLRICFETRSWPISCDQHTKSTGASILIILSRDTLIIRSAALGQEWRQADGAFEIQKCQRFLCHNLPRLGHCGQALVAHCNVVRFPNPLASGHSWQLGNLTNCNAAFSPTENKIFLLLGGEIGRQLSYWWFCRKVTRYGLCAM